MEANREFDLWETRNFICLLKSSVYPWLCIWMRKYITNISFKFFKWFDFSPPNDQENYIKQNFTAFTDCWYVLFHLISCTTVNGTF